MTFWAALFGMAALGLFLDGLFFRLDFLRSIPDFLPSALALAGLLLAALTLAARKRNKKPKKRRRAPFLAMSFSLIVSVLCAGYWLYRLVSLH